MCLMYYNTSVYSDWVLAHPGQAVLTVVSIRLKIVIRGLK